MERFLHRSLLTILLIANAGAVLLYCGQGAMNSALPGSETSWHPMLAAVSRVLTLPIPTGDNISAIRDVLLPVCLGLAMLCVALCAGRVSDGMTIDMNNPANKPAPRFYHSAERWLWFTSGAALFIAILSALANHTLLLSSGWIIRFFVGASWSILLARFFTPMMIRRAVMGMLVIAFACLVLALLHRADRRTELFTWPIGPITPTAAFAALWCAMAGGLVATLIFGAKSRSPSHVNFPLSLLAIGVLPIAAYVLQQTERRAPLIGLGAAVVLVFVLIIKRRMRAQRARLIVIAVVFLAITGAAGYVIRQKMSAVREVSGPLGIRFEYWRLAGNMMLTSPSLGYGADTFFIEMTNAVAPLRDVSPHFYHGDIDSYAHNEWIQSAVEIGIPGGLFYLLIPLGILFMAMIRLGAAPLRPADITSMTDLRAISTPTIAVVMALAAGLLSIIVTESAGITLRTALLPTWYWTMIGLLAAACRPAINTEKITTFKRPHWARIALPLLIAAGCFTASALDLIHAVDAAQPQLVPNAGSFRLYADKSVMSDWRAATMFSDMARASHTHENLERAMARWHDLNALIPGFRDTPARYSEALLLANQRPQARGIVEQVIDSGYTPHEVAANHILALLREDDPVVQLRCLQRAIRNAELRPALQEILRSIEDKPVVKELLARELPAARQFVIERRALARDDAFPELLRLNAFLKMDAVSSSLGQSGESSVNEAITDQRSAAEYYAFLEQTNALYRRGHNAEVDAWFVLARMLYDTHPAEYQQAFQAITTAERFALLGITHQRLAAPKAEYGYAIGEIMPTEFPERLRPLWELSALLHIIAGVDQFIDLRIYFSLPPEQWNSAAMNRKLAALTLQAREYLSKLPTNLRPAHYDGLLKMAERAEQAARQE